MTREALLAELRECGTEWTQAEDPAEDRVVFRGKYAGGMYNEQGHRKAESLLLAYMIEKQ